MSDKNNKKSTPPPSKRRNFSQDKAIEGSSSPLKKNINLPPRSEKPPNRQRETRNKK